MRRIAQTIVCTTLLVLSSTAFAQWNEQVLYSFQGGTDGQTPTGGIVFDQAGNLYGATMYGGASNCSPFALCGTVFELSPPANGSGSWRETVLHVFKGHEYGDGDLPGAGLVIDGQGNLYGTTAYGGTGNCVLLGVLGGCGTVYELSPPSQPGGTWTETIIYSFPNAEAGYLPNGDLVFDSEGNLYGVTEFGGGFGTSCNGFYQYCGAVFELSPPAQNGGTWTEKVLHGFRGTSQECCGNRTSGDTALGDGANPGGSLVFDKQGNLYGTTFYGGDALGNCNGGPGGTGCGTVFELSSPSGSDQEWAYKVIHRFDIQDGTNPPAGVVLDKSGNLYGNAAGPKDGYGLVFELERPSVSGQPWTETVLFDFDQVDGEYPEGPLAFDESGALYGTVIASTGYHGEVYRLTEASPLTGPWMPAVLHNFTNAPDGGHPDAPLIFDGAGNIYSTTQWGGTGQACQGGCGVVFELSP